GQDRKTQTGRNVAWYYRRFVKESQLQFRFLFSTFAHPFYLAGLSLGYGREDNRKGGIKEEKKKTISRIFDILTS
ncbi:hypothetical protein CEXT_133431, partial [Caerostris extrusa]